MHCQAQWHPELRLVKATGLQGKLEPARHNADDCVGLPIKNDGDSKYVRIAVIPVQPQDITDDRDLLMSIFLLLRKDPAQNRSDVQRRKYSCRKPSGTQGFRGCPARKLIIRTNVAAH